MKKIFILILLTAIRTFAGDRPTYEFLRSDVSARASAMAGSFVSMTNDPNTIFYNPASLATLTDPQVSLGFTKHLLDINIGSLSYGLKTEELGMIGFGVSYVNYGSFKQTNDLGTELGTFGAGDLAVMASISRPLDENLYYGVTAKFIYSSIADYNSTAVAADVGILYLIQTENPISLGATISNIGTQLSAYGSTKESLPLEISIGGSIKPQHLPLLLNVNFNNLNNDRVSFLDRFSAFTVGGEFTLSKVLRFRFGYNNESRKELKIGSTAGLAGFSFGGGLVLTSMKIDYAFNSLGKIGSLNRISIGIDI
jgi:hypothetical protein